jgi:hypothetical protein
MSKIIHCNWCDKEIVDHTPGGTRRFCNRSCQAKWQQVRDTKNNPIKNGDVFRRMSENAYKRLGIE